MDFEDKLKGDSWLVRKLRALHAEQSGAVAFMVLAAILISLMMGLVVYDATPAARQKMEVQTAADTAAWSQTSVDARNMNMIAFANVAKRVALGQSQFYQSLWDAWIALMVIYVVILVVLIVVGIFCFGCTSSAVQFMVSTIATAAQIMAGEASDGSSFDYFNTSSGTPYYSNQKIRKRIEEDLRGLDGYQTHFQALAPWWSWGEGW